MAAKVENMNAVHYWVHSPVITSVLSPGGAKRLANEEWHSNTLLEDFHFGIYILYLFSFYLLFHPWSCSQKFVLHMPLPEMMDSPRNTPTHEGVHTH